MPRYPAASSIMPACITRREAAHRLSLPIRKLNMLIASGKIRVINAPVPGLQRVVIEASVNELAREMAGQDFGRAG